MANKWEKRPLTAIELSEMEAAFIKRFSQELKQDEDFYVEGQYTEKELILTVILKNNEETFYYPFETTINTDDNKDLEMEAAKMLLLDFIGSYFEDYFSNDRDSYIPIDWTSFELDGKKLFAKGQVYNNKLEKMAVEILEAHGFNKDGGENGGNCKSN